MRPLKLKMQAFGSYGRETVIDFTKPEQNLFLITGDTGAGKTTIFDAIVFGCFYHFSPHVLCWYIWGKAYIYRYRLIIYIKQKTNQILYLF